MLRQYVRKASSSVDKENGNGVKEKAVSIITGSSRGVGAKVALRLALQRHRLVLHYHSQKKAVEKLAEQCAELGAEPMVYKVDLSRSEQCSSFIKLVARRYGNINYLVNSAGTTVFSKPQDIKVQGEHYDDIMALNLDAVYHLSMQATQYMPDEGGAIVNVASNAAVTGVGSSIPYTVSKAGVVALTKAMAIGFKDRNIRVNAVLPGMIDTPSWWEKRFPDSPEQLSAFMEKQQPNMVSAVDVAEQIYDLMAGTESGLTIPLLASATRKPDTVLKPS